ncbi:MAG: DegT/DnrJ/EryC1/StrS family aminotransferase [Candidatus Roizmanbacteria bacterium]|nr:DegT/DnrJ/EryC1/StrS family aminotransferase [Candidatus Roizmanbacteria bacterium]
MARTHRQISCFSIQMIPVSEPAIAPESFQKVKECLTSGWISGSSQYVAEFEKIFAASTGARYGVSVSNGTAALHLSCVALGIGVGDEVIVPNLTIISCALAPIYCGAIPVLVDVGVETGNLDPAQVEKAITPRTKAILVVHLLGHPADMSLLTKIARKHKLFIIEDCAEAHGALYKNRAVGTFGTLGIFSFYANKIITTGEGGMIVTNNKNLYKKMISLRNLAHSPTKRFFHRAIGFNYRLSGLQAALGIGQMSRFQEYIKKKRATARLYTSLLQDVSHLRLPIEKSYAKSVYWMYSVHLQSSAQMSRSTFMEKLYKKGVETRTFFFPLHRQPALKNLCVVGSPLSVSTRLAREGLYLPSGLTLSEQDVRSVVQAIRETLPT